MILGNILYTVSSENTIKYSEIPIYDNPVKYSKQLRKKYYVKKGKILTFGDQIISKSKNIFIINKNIDTSIANSSEFQESENTYYAIYTITDTNNSF